MNLQLENVERDKESKIRRIDLYFYVIIIVLHHLTIIAFFVQLLLMSLGLIKFNLEQVGLTSIVFSSLNQYKDFIHRNNKKTLINQHDL